MRDGDYEKLVIGGGLFVALAFWQGRRVAEVTIDLTTRGKRLTVATIDAIGDVDELPEDLAAAASAVVGYPVSVDLYSLARMGRSEGVDGKEMRMHVLLNDLAEVSRSNASIQTITDLVTFSTRAGSRGKYGEQSGRRYSTARDPYEIDLRIATKVLSDRMGGIDRADGAVKFADKSSFLVQTGTRSYEAVLAEWQAEGLIPFNLPGASSNFVLFKRA